MEEIEFKDFDVEKMITPSKSSEKSAIDASGISISSVQDTDNEPSGLVMLSEPRRISAKQKKATLEEYKDLFLTVPKITDRKTVFISNTLRQRIVDLVRKLGYEKSSVSGFVENLVADHLEQYQEEIDTWKKL